MAKEKEVAEEQKASDVELVFIALNTFAQAHAKKYGVELMGGFYHSQESKRHYADTEDNWHKLIEEFKGKEVK